MTTRDLGLIQGQSERISTEELHRAYCREERVHLYPMVSVYHGEDRLPNVEPRPPLQLYGGISNPRITDT